MIVQVARQGGRDAVFDVPEQLIRTGPRDPVVEIALTDDPQVKATGRVREVAPQADPATRTFQVKVGITDPPEAMRLGATVTGRVTAGGASRRGGPGERAHRGERAPGRMGGRSAEPDRVAAQRRCRCGTTRPASWSRRGWKRARSWSPPGCRRCARARRSGCWEARHERASTSPNGRSGTVPLVDLFHARHHGRGRRRPTCGSGGARTRTSPSRPWWCRPDGRAPRSATRSSRSPTASSASSRRRRTSTT